MNTNHTWLINYFCQITGIQRSDDMALFMATRNGLPVKIMTELHNHGIEWHELKMAGIDALDDMQNRLGHGHDLNSPDFSSSLTNRGRISSLEIENARGPRCEFEQSMSPTDTEKVLRFAAVLSLAAEVFRTEAQALTWLRTSNRNYDNAKPFEMLSNETGARLIMHALGQAQEGYFA